jgi:hypothetical protein
MDGTLTAMAFLGQNRLYDGISWNSHLSMAFLGLRRLSMAFLGLSLCFFQQNFRNFCNFPCSKLFENLINFE